MGWQDLVSQLKIIRASNPRREVNRITLGYCVKVGNLGNLCKAAGGVLRYLDLTYSKGVKNIGFRELAAQLPNLKGLAVREIEGASSREGVRVGGGSVARGNFTMIASYRA